MNDYLLRQKLRPLTTLKVVNINPLIANHELRWQALHIAHKMANSRTLSKVY